MIYISIRLALKGYFWIIAMTPSAHVKAEARLWAVYFFTVLLSIFVHEFGHCMVAWIHGFSAIPTPAKAYLTGALPDAIANDFSLGGILGTVLVSIATVVIFFFNTTRYREVLAGGIAMPGLNTLRFLLQGRGHDGTEFQEAQAAMGLSYEGHFLDWMFTAFLIAGFAPWLIWCKPLFRKFGRLVIGIIVTVFFVVFLQKANNWIFDPFF